MIQNSFCVFVFLVTRKRCKCEMSRFIPFYLVLSFCPCFSRLQIYVTTVKRCNFFPRALSIYRFPSRRMFSYFFVFLFFFFDFLFSFANRTNRIANPRGPCGALRCDRFFPRAFFFFSFFFTRTHARVLRIAAPISGYPPERLASLVVLENPAKIRDRCSTSAYFENSSKTGSRVRGGCRCVKK